MLSVELHAHSALSHDGRDPVEALLQRAQAVGLDGLAVTDHDAIEASLEAEELAADYGLVGIPGMEVSSAAGHVLALGVRELVPAGLPFEETLDRIRAQDGVAVVPHPFQRSRHGAHGDTVVDAAPDALEVYNAHTLTGLRNVQTRSFARRHGLPGVGGSDAHSAPLVGQARTELCVEEPTTSGVLDAIRAGRTRAVGRRTSTRQYVRKYASNAAIRMPSVR